MAGLRILGKTIDAFQLLRQPKIDLPKEARTLLLLVDGKRHFKELRMLARANGVQSFDETLAYLEQARLVQELPEADEDSLVLDDDAPSAPPSHLITLDLTVPARELMAARSAPEARGAPAAPVPKAAPAAPSAAADASDPRSEIRARLTELLRPEVEAELREKLRPEVRAALQKELAEKLETALRPGIERLLTVRIQNELKPRIEREFRERLERALATRLQAEGLSPSAAGCDPAILESSMPLVLELDDHRPVQGAAQ